MKRGPNGLEMLVSVLVVAVLISVITARYTRIKRAAELAGLKTELRDLVMAQEAYYLRSSGGEHGARYAERLEQLKFVPEKGVTIELRAGPRGWAAVARSANLPPEYFCSIYMGDIESFAAAAEEGVVTCEPI